MIARVALGVSIAVLMGASPAGAQDERGATLSSPVVALKPRAPEVPLVRYPRAVSERPLTLPQGIVRLDHGLRLFTPLYMPVGLSAGVFDELELSWAFLVPRVQIVGATVRAFHHRHVDLGVSASVTIPSGTAGVTLGTLAFHVLVRPIEWLRIDSGLSVDWLFSRSARPGVRLPLTVTLNPLTSVFVGGQGAATYVETEAWTIDVGGFFGFTWFNHRRPIAELRWSFDGYIHPSLPNNHFAFGFMTSFYPDFHPHVLTQVPPSDER